MRHIFIIFCLCLSAATVATAQSSSKQLANEVANAMAKNDTSSLFKLLPNYNHLMAYFKKHGVPIPSASEVAASKIIYENNVIRELKEDLMYERETCMSEGFDWSKMSVVSVSVKKEEEEYQEGTNIYLTTHLITLHLKDGKRKFTLELAAFEVDNVYKLLNVLNTNLEDL